jgi:hypothetical protein
VRDDGDLEGSYSERSESAGVAAFSLSVTLFGEEEDDLAGIIRRSSGIALMRPIGRGGLYPSASLVWSVPLTLR